METEAEKEWSKEEDMEDLPAEGEEMEEGEETDTAEFTSDGKYKCKVCGRVFDTLEEHDDHHRRMHERETEEQMPL